MNIIVKNKSKVLIALVITALLSITIIFSVSASERSDNFLDKELLKKEMNMQLEDASNILGLDSSDKKVEKAKAKDIVKEKYPKMYNDAKNVKAQLVKITDPGCGPISDEAKNKNQALKDKGYPENLLVWIVSLQGIEFMPGSNGALSLEDMEKYSNSDKETNKKLTPAMRKPHTEAEVVVDAVTGEVLYMFFYK